MKPLALSLRQVRSWRELDLDLPEGVTALLGANGAGKSSLANSIEAALFGPDGRSFADWYPRGGGTDPLMIQLLFAHQGEHYRVRRSYSPRGRGQSKFDFERFGSRTPAGELIDEWAPLTLESQTETQQRLEDLIGLSRESFRASSFLAQGETGLFCEARPGDRKRLLSEIVGLQEWDRWLEQARTEKRRVQSELDRIAGGMERAETELAKRVELEAQAEAQGQVRVDGARALAEASQTALTARDSLAEAQRRVDARAEIGRVVEAARVALASGETRVETTERELAALETRLAEREILGPLAESVPKLVERQEQLRAQMDLWRERQRLETEREQAARAQAEVDAKAHAMRAQANQVLVAVGEETCDRCGQTLGAEAAERAVMSYRSEADACDAQAQERSEFVAVLEAALLQLPDAAADPVEIARVQAALMEAQDAKERLVALAEAESRRESLHQDIADLRRQLPGWEQALGEAEARLDALGPADPAEPHRLEEALAAAVDHERQARDLLGETERQLARLEAELERLNRVAADVAQALAQRDSLLADADLYAALERACGQNGVPALILETVAIPQIETEASRILNVLGGPAFAVELRTLREKKTGGLADTLEVVCLTEDGEAGYESLSGGERARVAFALRLALAQLLVSRRGSETGLLVIDELEHLDEQGIAALSGLLEELADRVGTVLLVSHVPALRDSFASSLEVVKMDGVSTLLNGADRG